MQPSNLDFFHFEGYIPKPLRISEMADWAFEQVNGRFQYYYKLSDLPDKFGVERLTSGDFGELGANRKFQPNASLIPHNF